jgi:hypothetical protein
MLQLLGISAQRSKVDAHVPDRAQRLNVCSPNNNVGACYAAKQSELTLT